MSSCRCCCRPLTCLDCCDTDGFVVACTHSWKISALPQSRAVVLLALLAAISGLWLESTMARGEDPSAAVHLSYGAMEQFIQSPPSLGASARLCRSGRLLVLWSTTCNVQGQSPTREEHTNNPVQRPNFRGHAAGDVEVTRACGKAPPPPKRTPRRPQTKHSTPIGAERATPRGPWQARDAPHRWRGEQTSDCSSPHKRQNCS